MPRFAKNKVTDIVYPVIGHTKKGMKLLNPITDLIFIVTPDCYTFFEFIYIDGGI